MIWLKRLWARLTGGQVVWLRDFDHAICTRIARNTPFGLMAWRYGLGVQQVFLLPDGTTRGCCYVVAWKPDVHAAGSGEPSLCFEREDYTTETEPPSEWGG